MSDIIEEQKKKLTEEINPDDIIIDDDSDMPAPESKTYEQRLQCTEKFILLFKESIGNMPYATTLTNTQGGKIKLIDLARYVENNYKNISVQEMNTVVSFIANADFKYVRPLMEVIEDTSRQGELWHAIQ